MSAPRVGKKRGTLSDAQIEFQAEKFLSYSGRGGDPDLWIRSKGFGPADRQRILKVIQRLQHHGAGE